MTSTYLRPALAGLAVLLVAAGIYWGLVSDSAESPTTSLVPVNFATDWKAQAELGGFYQAKALGLYEKAGLDVTIRQGGPAINIPQLLAAGAIDFGVGSNNFIPINMVEAGVPAKAVMAVFQKDPQVLITHPRDDVKSIADIQGKPVMVADATIGAFWVWLRAKYGFEDSQIRKYTFNVAPFLADPQAIQQGYVTSEPYLIQQASGVEPQVFLLSDYGYPGYATFVMARDELIETRPEVVQAFVNATIEGWYQYLYGDPAPGNALIKADNPEMTDDAIAQALDKMRSYGLADSGDTVQLGLGAMTDARWQAFFTTMSQAGVFDASTDYRKAYDLRFVNKGHGLALKDDLIAR